MKSGRPIFLFNLATAPGKASTNIATSAILNVAVIVKTTREFGLTLT